MTVILGGSDHVQVHDQSHQDFDLSLIPAYLHHRDVVPQDRLRDHDFCNLLCNIKHCRHRVRVHTDPASLGPRHSRKLLQLNAILVRECSFQHLRRLYDPTCANARGPRFAAPQSTEMGPRAGIRAWVFVSHSSSNSSGFPLTGFKRLYHVSP